MSDCRTLEDVAPGSPAGIRSLAARIDTTADEAREARQETMGIAQTTGSVAWEGDAAEGFVQSVEKLPPLLALMGSSYDGVVAALGRYAEELEDLRARARRSCEDCAAARRRQAEAQRDLGGAEQRASALAGEQRSAWLEEQTARASAVVDPGAAAQLPALSSRRSQLDSSARQADQETERLRQELDDAEEDEEAAHRRLDQLSDEREDAEKACAERIRDALVEDLENPGFWEKAGNLVGDALDAVEEWVDEHADILTKISGVLKTVSAIAGVLSLIPGANVIFGPIAVAAGGAALLIDAVLVATGNGDWKTLLLDAALMALPGVGKLVKTALKPAAGAVKASRAAKAARGSGSVPRPTRLARDINVNPKAPAPKRTNRPVGGSATQNQAVQQRILDLQARRARDIRVNQQQVDINGQRVGVNRPDLQYTQNGKRYYEEYDVPSSNRGPGHKQRIEANDPTGTVVLLKVP